MIRFALAALLLTVSSVASAQRTFDTDILRETFGFDQSTPATVSLDDLHQGCPARDCIPSIDDPKFVSASEAAHVDDDDVVIAISIGDDHRAYPARILDHHEIVNDVVDGIAVAITWCPLCGSAVGISREVGDTVTEFGVSGVLYNSDLVLYDRATNTLWDQVGTSGIVGELTGERLILIPVTMTTFGRWRTAHPDTRVLSTETGFERDYSSDRFAAYRNSSNLWFPVASTDDSVHPKTVVFGFELDGAYIAFTEDMLSEHGTYVYTDDGRRMVVTLHDDGSVVMNDDGKWRRPIRLYWFAWYTFHPDTILVAGGEG